MKSLLVNVDDHGVKYQCLAFICAGCAAAQHGTGLHMLPVNCADVKNPQWDFDGNLDKPTLNPSILTRSMHNGKPFVCHSYLRNGVFEFLGDCTHSLVNQHVEMPDLPDWLIEERG